MKISVVIVSYNARYFLEQCLYSVRAALSNWEGEVIVVDNDSPEKPIPEIRSKFPDVTFIESKKNLGFAKANNLGVEKSRGDYVLILNPDTLLPENLFEELIPFAENTEQLGAVGVRMVDANGRFHPESKRNIPGLSNTFGKLFGTAFDKKKAKGYYKSDIDQFAIAPAEILVGAFMFIKKSVYEKVGGFDPRYFMYGEDIDLSYSLILNGYTNYYYGKSTVIHYKGESTRKDKKYLKTFFGAMQLFVSKYYKTKPVQFLLFSSGLRLRYLWAKLSGGFKAGDRNIKNPHINPKSLVSICSEEEIDQNSNQYLLHGSTMSNQEMILLISHNFKENRFFYIQPKQMNVLLGDSGVIKR